MKDSPAALAAVPHLVPQPRRTLTRGSIVTSLDPVRIADGDVCGRRRPHRARPATATRVDCSGVPRHPGQRLRAHAPLLGARARDAVRARRRPTNFLADPPAGLVAARPRARRGGDPRVGARRRHGGAPLRDDDARRPPRVAERDRRLARRDRGRARRARRPLGALLRDHRPRRAGARARRHRRRTAASSTRAREQPPLARGLVGAHASLHALRRDARRLCGASVGPGSTSTRPRTASTGRARSTRLERLGRCLDERTLLAHGVHLDDAEVAAVRAAGATVAHNARSNMNNSVGRAPVGALGPRLALGTDGIGSDMFEESHAAYFRLREDDVAHRRRLAARAARRVGAARRPRLRRAPARDARARRAGRSRRPRLSRARARHRRELRRPLGLRPLVTARPRRDGRRASGSSATAGSRMSTRTSSPRVPARRPRRLWARLDDVPPHPFSPKEAHDGPRSSLSPGQAPDPRRHALRAARRAGGVRGGVAGREPARPRGDRADGGVRRGHRADRDRRAASSTRGRATSACSRRRSRRSTTSPPGA